MQDLFNFHSKHFVRWSLVFFAVGACSLRLGPDFQSVALAQEQNPPTPEVSQTKEVPANHPLVGVLRLAKASRDRIKAVPEYECRFFKRDLVGGRVYVHSTQVKFRAKPLSVYMRFDKPAEGREVIYVEGQNDGKLLAHEVGIAALVGIIALPPGSPQALSESRHPISEFGMENLVEGTIAQWEREAQFAASETEAKFYPKAKLHKMECQVIETRHPVPRRQFPFYMTRLYIDNKTLLPVRLEQYGFPQKAGEKPPLIEEYTYYQIRPTSELSDRDFDPRNPNYGF